MMTPSIVALLAVFQVAASNANVWQVPTEPQAPMEAGQASRPPATERPALPTWAVEDPYAWERSQCHPALRGGEAMDHCQVRVRLQLKAELGDRLPVGLQPEAISSCRQTSDGSGGFHLTCAPEARTISMRSAPAAEICEQRPRALPGGGVTFEQTCRPETAPRQEGLSIPLFRGNR